jgi:putative endonuclease
MRTYYVYILANRHRRIYIGVTSDLVRRLHLHRTGRGSEFVHRYQMTQLVHVESCSDVHAAIAREKQLKGWVRGRKVSLIEAGNPGWEDLGRLLLR